MKQYISKAAVMAEIEARYNECLKRAKIIDAEYWNGKADAYRDMLVTLDTLEAKEVDFDREIRRYRMNNPIIGHREESLYDYMANVAKHFFELGIKAQKGE